MGQDLNNEVFLSYFSAVISHQWSNHATLRALKLTYSLSPHRCLSPGVPFPTVHGQVCLSSAYKKGTSENNGDSGGIESRSPCSCLPVVLPLWPLCWVSAFMCGISFPGVEDVCCELCILGQTGHFCTVHFVIRVWSSFYQAPS